MSLYNNSKNTSQFIFSCASQQTNKAQLQPSTNTLQEKYYKIQMT